MTEGKMSQDLALKLGKGRLNIRVAAIIRRDDAVLASQWGKDISLIGGRVAFGEDTAAAVVREVKEETGCTAEETVFRAIVENFYSYKGELCHEFLFLYEVKIGNQKIDPSSIDYDKQLLYWAEKQRWHELKPAVLESILTGDRKGFHFMITDM